MPLTVTYFNAKGAAEITRLVLACAGVDYKDRPKVRLALHPT